MRLTSNHYLQFHDYLTQITENSEKQGIKKIRQASIATLLSVDPAGVCRFLLGETKQPKKMLSNFIGRCPLEFQKWPIGKNNIERILTKNDMLYFLNPNQGFVECIHLPTAIKSNQKRIKNIALQSNLNALGNQLVVPEAVKDPALNITSANGFIPTRLLARPILRKSVKVIRADAAPIVISYRGHHSEKDAAGMLFDHMRLQMITNHPTLVLSDSQIENRVNHLFANAIKNHAAALPFGDRNTRLPPFVNDCSESGLLVVPGRVHSNENEPIRLRHEYKVIREALNRGQPILGICAGIWRVWEQLHIWTKFPDTLNYSAQNLLDWHQKYSSVIDVLDHAYGGGMIRLGANGTQATYNVQIHDVMIQQSTLLSSILKNAPHRQSVNSVHWKAVNHAQTPKNIVVSAFSLENPSIDIQTRQQTKMHPQEGTVEAFESIHGAPIMGLQWHPEGYPKNSVHAEFLRYMAQAGNAYVAKRKVLKQIQETVPQT